MAMAMDGYATSDAEMDSELESDSESELTLWLDHLNTYSKDALPEPVLPLKRVTLTPKEVMESFRSSVLEGGDGGASDLDLDAILGDLCELESQLVTTQTEINDSIQRTNRQAPPAPAASAAPVAPAAPSSAGTSKENTDFQWDKAIDDQLQNALCILSDITGSSFETKELESNLAKANNNNDLDNGLDLSGDLQHMDSQCNGQPPGVARDALVAKDISLDNRKSHDLSPDDTDSAFSDNVSLPSSGSHVSVTTTNSGNSAGTSGISSSVGGGASPPARHSAEVSAKLKAEKVRIALEKIKEANIKKLFARVYAEDGSSKSVLVDEQMAVAHVADLLVAKNHVQPDIRWALVEEIPDLYMERTLEDHACLVEHMLLWLRDSTNKLSFVQRPNKYDVFLRPELYLLTSCEEEMENTQRDALIQEHFGGEGVKVPELESMLYLKSEGKKAWKKFYFVLRASGLYYNPKGKGRTSKDLVCLQKLDLMEVYTGIGWKKKYKAPTQFGFAVKHAQIQKKNPKYIKYLCAEDLKTLNQWLTGIRIARYGQQLYKNYQAQRANIDTWEEREVLPNPNFSDYVARQHSLTERYTGRQSYAGAVLTRHGSVRAGSVHDRVASSVHDRVASSSSLKADDLVASLVARASVASTASLEREELGRQNSFRGSDDTDSGRVSIDSDSEGKRDSLLPAKMIPVLPVTTQTTRQISEQHMGTLRKQGTSPRKVKRSPTSGSSDLLPPPPDTKPAEDSTEAFPPPPSAESLQNIHAAVTVPKTPPETKPKPVLHGNFVPASPQSSPLHQPGHQRSSSTSSSLNGSPARQKPPPPPKRCTATKLSIHGDSPQQIPFMADLQRTLASREEELDLPPPPAELLEGLPPATPKKKPPPTPPKRSMPK